MSDYFNSKCEHQAAAIQTCVSDSASEKSAVPKVAVSQTYPHCAWELFPRVMLEDLSFVHKLLLAYLWPTVTTFPGIVACLSI